MALKSGKAIGIQRIPHTGADYIRLSGAIDRTFSAEKLGAITQPTVIDLHDVDSITSQGVERWCEFVKGAPPSQPLFLVNMPSCVAAQVEFVPNFAGHAEIITVAAMGKCVTGGHEQRLLIDLLNYSGGSQLLDRCGQCGAALVVADLNLEKLAKSRARALSPEMATVLDTLGVYRRSTARGAFEVQKLIEGNVSLLRMSGTIDDRFRGQRLVAGLEGTLLLITSDLEVTESGGPRFVELLAQMAHACSPIVIVNLPYAAIKHMGLQQLPQVVVHSIMAPSYCATCDEMRQLSVGTDELLGPEPKGTCLRCGRPAAMVAGMVQLDQIRPQLRPTPEALLDVIGRFDELFSAAEVEAKLTTSFPSEPSNAAPQRIGPYRIVRSIARGGMADVFLAVRDDFSKPVALKLLRREVLAQARISLAMFLREARLNAKLNHPNIVQVFDVNEAEGNLYIVMEYLEGHALWRVFRQVNGPFPVAVAIRIVQQVLRALHHVQTARDSDGKPLAIVHRDVSPSNIIVCPDGNVKLIDFGIAISGSNPDVFAGNPAWMSPEQFSGGALDGRSDLFSVATVLHELLSGKQLFDAKTVPEIAQQVIRGAIPLLPGIPTSLALVLRRAHERDPAARFQTAGQFAEALRVVAEENRAEASEHEVRVFVSEAMSGAKPPSAPRLSDPALMPTPPSGAADLPGPLLGRQGHDNKTVLQPPTNSLLRAATAEPAKAPSAPTAAAAPKSSPSVLPSSVQTPLPLSQLATPPTSGTRLLIIVGLLFVLAFAAILLVYQRP